MEPWLYELSWMMASLLLGVGLGSLTGLIPGFHVNNVALILLSVSPALLSLGIPLCSCRFDHFNRCRTYLPQLHPFGPYRCS